MLYSFNTCINMEKIDSNHDRIIMFLLNYYSLNSETDLYKNFKMLQKIGIFSNPKETEKNIGLFELSKTTLDNIINKSEALISHINSNCIGNHQIIDNIGSGSFGYIFRTYNKLDNHNYAIKVIRLDSSYTEDNRKLIEECSIMADLEHPNIIRYYSSWIEKNNDSDMNLYLDDTNRDFDENSDEYSENSKIVTYGYNMYLFIQMELCSKDLGYYIQNRTNINYNEILELYTQIVVGLDYLHSKNIIHRDIKPSNIFLTEQNYIKIGDFGMSKKMNRKNMKEYLKGSDEYGTNNYLAPEVIEYNRFSIYSDIYGIGIILYELLTIFKTNMERYINLKELRDLKLDTKFLLQYKKESEIICKLLNNNPKLRMDTQQILNLKNIIKE